MKTDLSNSFKTLILSEFHLNLFLFTTERLGAPNADVKGLFFTINVNC